MTRWVRLQILFAALAGAGLTSAPAKAASAAPRCTVSLQDFKGVWSARPGDVVEEVSPCKFSITNPAFAGSGDKSVQVVAHETIGLSRSQFEARVDNLRTAGDLCRSVPNLGDAAYYCYSRPSELLILKGQNVSAVLLDNMAPNPGQGLAIKLANGFLDLVAAPGGRSTTVVSAPPVRAGTAHRSDLTDTALNLSGLPSADILRKIYVGDFSQLTSPAGSANFALLFDGFLMRCGVRCKALLPPNRVELTSPKCVTYQQMVNGFGTPVGGRTCAEWTRVGRGVYAEPEAAAADEDLQTAATARTTANFMANLFSSDPVGQALATTGGLARDADTWNADLDRLFTNNPCADPPMRRLKENLVRFASGKPPIIMNGHAG